MRVWRVYDTPIRPVISGGFTPSSLLQSVHGTNRSIKFSQTFCVTQMKDKTRLKLHFKIKYTHQTFRVQFRSFLFFSVPVLSSFLLSASRPRVKFCFRYSSFKAFISHTVYLTWLALIYLITSWSPPYFYQDLIFLFREDILVLIAVNLCKEVIREYIYVKQRLTFYGNDVKRLLVRFFFIKSEHLNEVLSMF